MDAVTDLAEHVGLRAACDALGASRATWYRRQAPAEPRPNQPCVPARRIPDAEREQVLEVLCSERFVERAPAEVVATLFDEGCYLCSERTMYRIITENQAVSERRNQLRHPNYSKPELVATGFNQVWSWDVTKLLGPQKWSYFYLYVLIDIFSRYVVGWMVAERENANLASRLIEQTCLKHGVEPGTLVLHSDRGSPQTVKCTAQLLADLGVMRSLSRPHASDDNPYSEAQFKTLKYHPTFPKNFSCEPEALGYCRNFFSWYNDEHRHAGIAMLTPATLYYGRAEQVLAARQKALDAAFDAHPERFVRGRPTVTALREAVWINKPTEPTEGSGTSDEVAH